MDEFTPSTADIRRKWVFDYYDDFSVEETKELHGEFERWLTEHDREVAAKALLDAAVQIPEQMRLDELGLHLLDYTHQLPERSRVMLNGATRFAERLVMRATVLGVPEEAEHG